MKSIPLLLCLLITSFCLGQTGTYQSLDAKHPIAFYGDHIVFEGKRINLGPASFFIDGNLPDSFTENHRYVFNSVQKAVAQLTNGTEAEPMRLYMAPYVYWIDNPDDTTTRIPTDGSTPYGMMIKCDWLQFYGLTDNPYNVVMACNRGQTIGAKGNFTMFRFTGQGTSAENVTFGNYCNVDLVFPLKPSLNRSKRASAIVQAQLIHCNGDKIVARNTNFISRLNLCPFVGAKRVLFDRCHFESTDDALCGTAVYLHSTFDFYSSKPFYRTIGTGAVFLNCEIRSMAGNQQYFTKAGGQVAVIDSRIRSQQNQYWGWMEVVPPSAKNYQYNVKLNGNDLYISKADENSTVELKGKQALQAYRFTVNGKPIYNTYNLLSGDDDWDPMMMKSNVLLWEKEHQQTLRNLPVQLIIHANTTEIETKKNEAMLTASLFRFGNYPAGMENIIWKVANADKAFVQLKPAEDGKFCTVIPLNKLNTAKKVLVTATTKSGLEASVLLIVSPQVLDAPAFLSSPAILLEHNGEMLAYYRLNTAYADESDIKWYRCTDAAGSNPVEIAVSRFNIPLKNYRLSAGDKGYYIAMSIAPKHIRSLKGKELFIVSKNAVTEKGIKTNPKFLETDFKNLSLKNQPAIIPGFWTWDHIIVQEQDTRNNTDPLQDAWYYGEGIEGAGNMMGLLQGRHARMSYTPVGEHFGDMKLSITVAPFKTAGQGFSVAHLYMDVLIKMDAKTGTGYAFRLIRTTKYGDAVDCLLMKYENGVATPLTEPISTSAYRTASFITVELKGNKLMAELTTSSKNTGPDRPGIAKAVKLEIPVTTNEWGAFGIEYNGGSPAMINTLKAEWQ